jgi:hypothetical protein
LALQFVRQAAIKAMLEENTWRQKLPVVVLFILGLFDLFRGVAHTYLIHWANDTFAHLDLTVNGQDQLVLLSAFGISNFLTGMTFILVSLKARALAASMILIILLAYLFGWLGMQYAGVSPNSDFYGRFIMLGYLGVCVLTLLVAWTGKKIT